VLSEGPRLATCTHGPNVVGTLLARVAKIVAERAPSNIVAGLSPTAGSVALAIATDRHVGGC
jgi:hypothetical protein